MSARVAHQLAASALAGMALGLAACSASGTAPPEVVEVVVALPSTDAGALGDEASRIEADENRIRRAELAEQRRRSKNCCRGRNECKGKGNCKTDGHGCKGMNECKALGGCRESNCVER